MSYHNNYCSLKSSLYWYILFNFYLQAYSVLCASLVVEGCKCVHVCVCVCVCVCACMCVCMCVYKDSQVG